MGLQAKKKPGQCPGFYFGYTALCKGSPVTVKAKRDPMIKICLGQGTGLNILRIENDKMTCFAIWMKLPSSKLPLPWSRMRACAFPAAC